MLCPGPGHSAKDRSLSVKIGKDGQPVTHSFCGDDPIACKDYVRQRLGMEPFQPNGGRKTVATYDFRDPATGEVRYRKERVESANGSKSFFFKPKRRNGSEPLLYGGERLADVASEQPVFIVEGEKMVDRLRELGAVAVSGDTGYESKWLPSHANLLRNLQIILWPDSDAPGEEYAAKAARCLNGSATSFRVVRPFGKPNGAKGRDVCDWHGNADDLAALAAGAEVYVAIEANGDGAPGEGVRFELIPFDAIAIDTAPACLVKGLIPRVGLTVFWGPPKCGKSFLVFDMLMHVALGWEYRGKKVRQGPVVYCALESCYAFKNRIEAFRQERLQENTANVAFYLMAAPLSLVADHGALICLNPGAMPKTRGCRHRHPEPFTRRLGKLRRGYGRLYQSRRRNPGRLQLRRGYRPPLRP